MPQTDLITLHGQQLVTNDIQMLGHELTSLGSQIIHAIEAEFARRGLTLTFTQFLIIKCLVERESVTAKALGVALNMVPSAITRQLDRLEAKGYLRRLTHQRDRRALQICLSDAGHRMWTLLFPGYDRVMRITLQSLSQDESANFRNYAQRALRALEASD